MEKKDYVKKYVKQNVVIKKLIMIILKKNF